MSNVSDPVADLLTRIRNANIARHEKVVVPSSKLKVEIARLLQQEGYVDGYEVSKDGQFEQLVITLKYSENRERVISGLKRISKPGRRIYAKHDRLPKVLGGLGTAILSTPTGVITSRQAAERGVGGEVICFVW
jgi:small subunit ribosomal protein S8